MREIKFRAWDAIDSKWRYFKIGETMTTSTEMIYGSLCLMGVTFYQFTGLLDKSRKEIYEGDILSAGGRVIGHIEGGVRGYCYDVVYAKPTAGGEKRWSLYATVEIDYKGLIEVIGNIHEHKHLLQ
jgi:uncharacterized phage protein (TIGR01671 family)